MGSAADWHVFLDELRSFGGRAENVMQRKGGFGMGLFPIDPSKPVDLHIPASLLNPIENIELSNGNLVVKDNQDFPEGYADWFERYEAIYSWGSEGRESILAFEEGLKNLPENIQIILKRNGIYNSEIRFPGKDPDNELLQRFIRTRCINYQGKSVIMPIIDLVNHSPSAKPYDMSQGGITISGMFDGEVLVKYNVSDPIRRLMGYGFNAPEPMGFSIRCQIQHLDHAVVVQPGVNNQPMQPCKVSFQDDRLIVQQPLLGSLRSPKMPRTLFLQACKEVEGINASELFDQIQQSNTIALVKIVRELQDVEGEIAANLRFSCLDQLAAQSHCFGQRDDILNG